VLWLVALVGCAETYRRGGRADRAAHKDTQERLDPSECTQKIYDEFCRDDEESEECLKYCGD
jgi:hypothetical protein